MNIQEVKDALASVTVTVACHPKDQVKVSAVLAREGLLHQVDVHPTPWCGEGTYYLMQGLPVSIPHQPVRTRYR